MTIRALRRSGDDGTGLFVDTIEELVACSDQIVLCAPATAETHHIIKAGVLSACKPQAHLISGARGSLVDHAALRDALDTGRLRHATLDVTDPEPLPDNDPLYAHPSLTLTPHVAWYSADHHIRLTERMLSNLGAWTRGAPLSGLVERGRGYCTGLGSGSIICGAWRCYP